MKIIYLLLFSILTTTTSLSQEIADAGRCDDVQLLDPIIISQLIETKVNTASPPRKITWSVATQYKQGYYNGSFDWSAVRHGLEFLERYQNIDYVQIGTSGARLQIVQANTQKIVNAAAWTNGNIIYISPTFNFSKNYGLCAKVILHENGHAIRGGTSHNPNPLGIMSVNGGTSGNIILSDAPWYTYPWKSTLRPWHEPERMRQEFRKEILYTEPTFSILSNKKLEVLQNEEDSMFIAP